MIQYFIGGAVILACLVVMGIRWWRGEAHTDGEISRYFDWPLIITVVLLLVPTPYWWDYFVGIAVMIAFELYKWVRTKRRHAEHDYAKAVRTKDAA